MSSSARANSVSQLKVLITIDGNYAFKVMHHMSKKYVPLTFFKRTPVYYRFIIINLKCFGCCLLWYKVVGYVHCISLPKCSISMEGQGDMLIAICFKTNM